MVLREQELDKKLAEWAGFEFKEVKFGTEIIPQWCGINFADWEPPKFTQSLDACFKWLVLKLKKEGYTVSVYFGLETNYATAGYADSEVNEAVYNSNPALALCLAIEKLIDEEK